MIEAELETLAYATMKRNRAVEGHVHRIKMIKGRCTGERNLTSCARSKRVLLAD